MRRKTTFRTSNVEPYTSYEPLGAKALEGMDTPCSLHIHSRRFRLADPDGISAKAAIDGIVRAGILKDDSAHYVKEIIYSQEQVYKAKGEEEETIITIEEA